MTTGLSLVSWRVLRNKEISSAVSGLAIQPRGLREKIWTVSQPVSLATRSASCKPPLIGAWKPIFGIRFLGIVTTRSSNSELSPVLLVRFHHAQHVPTKNLIDVAF